MTDFDLLYDPWIPCLMLSGEADEFSLAEALRQAHRIERIADASPLDTFGMLRFLIAVVRRYQTFDSVEAWEEAWMTGRFTEAFVLRVEKGCERRLRLFDDRHPFYQSGDIPLEGKPTESLKSVGYLAPEASTGTNIIHFDHGVERDHAFCPVCCAKGLVALPMFACAGGRGQKPSINGVPPVYVMPQGANLFATLMLNYVVDEDYLPRNRKEPDPGPLWESSGTIESKRESPNAGFLQSLTWPVRRTRLYPDEGGVCSRCGRTASILVRRIIYEQGSSLTKGGPPWDDPWVAFQKRKGEKDSEDMIPVRPREDRNLWRDFPALFLSGEGSGNPPTILRQLNGFIQDRRSPISSSEPMRYEAVGLRTDMKAKIFEWRDDRFEFPPGLLSDMKAQAAIIRALQFAEDASRNLAFALKKLHPVTERNNPDRDAVAKAMKALSTQAARDFWHRLEGEFRMLLSDALLRSSDESRSEWSKVWSDSVGASAKRAFENILDSYDDDADSLRRQQTANAVFYGGMKKTKEKHYGGNG